MKKKIMLGIALLCLCILTARTASIDPFALAVNGVPNSPQDEINYLNYAIQVWNGDLPEGQNGTEIYSKLLGSSAPRPLPLVLSDINYIKDASPSSAEVTLDGTAQYLVVHWGGQYGGADTMYYFDGPSGTYDLVEPFGLGGISSITRVWGNATPPDHNVPDGGSSLALFGMGLCALFTVARGQKKT